MSVGSEDLGWALAMLGGFLLIVGGIAGMIAWAGRREGGWMTVVRAGINQASATIVGLSFGARALLGLGQVLAVILVIVPGAVVAVICGPTASGGFSLTVPLWPIGAALALGALGAVFRRGAVLLRETEGLV